MAVKFLPKLFKKSSTGAVLEWIIGVDGTTIVTSHGQVGGKIQTTKDTVKAGKNAGRKNATAPEEQALKEAKAKWTKQKKSGYVGTFTAAEAGETDSLIEGGVVPMLAKVYGEHVSKITYPVAVQPKLDGHRCIAMITLKGEVSLWTRTRKRITSVPHIEAKLKPMAEKMKPTMIGARLRGQAGVVILDGELYNHDLREEFEKITSGARKEGGNEHSVKLQYHVYDVVSPLCFKDRMGLLKEIVTAGGDVVELVNTKYANSEEEAAMYFTLFKKLGYEGSMVRLLGRGYENRRSHQLLKVKTFEDAEFEIIDVVEGRGKLAGHGIFVCKTGNPRGFKGKEFNVKMADENEKLKDFWENREKYIGQLLTVQFQGRTGDGIPRFPVGLRIREDL